MYKENPTGKIDYDKASWQLGTSDERTIKKHYTRIDEIITKTTTRLAEYLSGIPSFGSLPEPTPSHNRYEILEIYLQMFDKAGARMRGETEKTDPIVILAKTYCEEKARNPVFQPLNFVSYLLHFHDTS